MIRAAQVPADHNSLSLPARVLAAGVTELTACLAAFSSKSSTMQGKWSVAVTSMASQLVGQRRLRLSAGRRSCRTMLAEVLAMGSAHRAKTQIERHTIEAENAAPQG